MSEFYSKGFTLGIFVDILKGRKVKKFSVLNLGIGRGFYDGWPRACPGLKVASVKWKEWSAEIRSRSGLWRILHLTHQLGAGTTKSL